jgi:uncharacterized protein with von Willebrand factor type A (vWA) domain
MDSFDFFSTLLASLTGLIIGALAVFYRMKSQLAELQQAGTQRRIGLLEQVAQHIGKVSHVYGKYASLVNEIGPRSERMSAKQLQELEALSTELVAVYEEVAIAESKLLLLGELRLEKALKLYTGKMAQFRRQVYPGRYNSAEEANALKQQVSEMRVQFYDVLSQRYDQKTS